MPSYDNKVAIIIGGSAGVGRATVDALLDRGYAVGVVARGRMRLDELEQMGVATYGADAGDAGQLDAAADHLVGRLGTPTVWVNCAMATSFSAFKDTPAEDFERVIRTTLMGQVNGTRAALRHMIRGNIVNIGSGLSYRAVPLQSAYCAAKHAINGFTASVRSELIAEDSPIHLSLVQLPAMNTPQFDWARSRLAQQPQPAPPVYTARVAADAVLRAIDTNARELFVGNSVLKLVFGQFLVPNYLDNRMSRDGITGQKSDRPAPGVQQGNLYEPVDYPTSPAGSYGDRASDSGVIVDADRARKGVFFGLPLLALAAGVAAGLAGARANRSRRLPQRDARTAIPRDFGGDDYRGS
ncbi:Short-chain dehydrogenase [Loktanella atrilutea]|uniref:Short-chain dehydrogenase n=1 Tax=Loktanella atrilutea TaxID=366533 RepID=A0A1M4TY83_LOKAT|nr:SDR family oxidoreductase [Loktanella atrilutea]SHE49412.1 Short-chain dehydrogenase [Loktanella atrilutea]